MEAQPRFDRQFLDAKVQVAGEALQNMTLLRLGLDALAARLADLARRTNKLVELFDTSSEPHMLERDHPGGWKTRVVRATDGQFFLELRPYGDSWTLMQQLRGVLKPLADELTNEPLYTSHTDRPTNAIWVRLDRS